jgi:hypothetical protein
VADLQKKNGEETVGAETISILDEKRQYLLDKLSDLMEQTSGDYGPLLMQELQRRLEFVVQNFNEELKVLIKSSFEEWKVQDSQIRDLMARDIQILKSQPIKKELEDFSRPGFIKDVEFGPIRSK